MILFLQQQHEESEDCLPARLPVTDLKLAIRAEGYARVIVVVLVEVSVVLVS